MSVTYEIVNVGTSERNWLEHHPVRNAQPLSVSMRFARTAFPSKWALRFKLFESKGDAFASDAVRCWLAIGVSNNLD